MRALLLILALLAVCQAKSLHSEEVMDALDCDHHFKHMSKIAAANGIDYTSIWFRNRNKSHYDCIMYYLKFIESLGFDISDLRAAFLPGIPERMPAKNKLMSPYHPSDMDPNMRFRL